MGPKERGAVFPMPPFLGAPLAQHGPEQGVDLAQIMQRDHEGQRLIGRAAGNRAQIRNVPRHGADVQNMPQGRVLGGLGFPGPGTGEAGNVLIAQSNPQIVFPHRAFPRAQGKMVDSCQLRPRPVTRR